MKRVRQEGESSVYVWDAELIQMGEAIDEHRKSFLDAYVPFLNRYLQDFLKLDACRLDYKRGWDTKKTLEEALISAGPRDIALGYTTVGTHRADIKFYLDAIPVETMFSRGQLKLFVSALMLARSEWLLAQTGRNSVFFLDDLHSELDGEAGTALLKGLKQMGGQVWITAIEGDCVQKLLSEDKDAFKMFHVEHGTIREEVSQ